MDNNDLEYDYFEKWFDGEQRRFHCAQMDDKQIAFSAFCEGIEFAKLQLIRQE